jgi:hypothetical protein
MNTKHKKESNSNTNKYKLISVLSLLSIFVVSLYFGIGFTSQPAMAEDIIVYKSPTCGCCKKWVKHLEKEGFKVTSKDVRNMKPVKNMFGVDRKFQSCHTAKVGGYFIEGHVPASDIKKLLKEKPEIKGLAVPGMPMGSPGMEGHRKDKYNVITIDKNNKTTVYSSH